MALGEFNLFTWKSKEKLQKEQDEYAKWAFPYGQKQRDNLEALLREVFPKTSVPLALIPFLTCKELYNDALEKSGSREKAIHELSSKQINYKQIIKKKEMSTYIALVIADSEIDEQCEYPTADAIRMSAQDLVSLR